jgi:hypothetical protein
MVIHSSSERKINEHQVDAGAEAKASNCSEESQEKERKSPRRLIYFKPRAKLGK